MASEPWLVVVGVGEDGPDGLPPASRAAVAAAEIVFGGRRHLALLGIAADRARPWPVPFDVAPVLAVRGRLTAVLASGDPFWFGAGAVLAERLDRAEWTALPAPSTFALAAARLGWRLETTRCLGLHATPFETALPVLHRGARLLCLVADAAAVGGLAAFLAARGFGASRLVVLERLGGPHERVRSTTADAPPLPDVAAPVAVAVEVAGGPGLSAVPGRPDDLFEHDGQITRAAVRALTLAALAPRPGEHLWDLGTGSGSVAIEWCLAGGTASAVERRPDRAAVARRNADVLGVGRSVRVVEGSTGDVLDRLPPPDAVFVGGGADDALIARVVARSTSGCRLVVNAVTLETERLVVDGHARHGGRLTRIDLAEAAPLGRMRGFVPARPIVQWSVTL
ncbi:precorrin-6y C5,15-methyltransferase (decarboxylating) subunit CbiE [Oharaeibacter diazotrophicus]|uniref:Precorrin-6Y C5,15-methyltransferase (Decarboxylating) n=1 Tax=Oharaeibacter diazotrophicus TaxID=1920512 RepID=A0A4V3CW95_9HYPH|nr:precorrin-6y C5,15-methyltransferase (decarboxylating) subunit CbiE [Oharaeibacter diazotrophicus]TDP85498.1 precorrin-6Y C5,15-methyltransferase (decarboxylating) [Oharaeibacter diazotrophicus]BBE74468.1 precorrin-6Y C(5,15)-methyltransferase [decarboxylating] [Pleomorphomonas sp. SM30]GLS75836.1 precorrin-6Y methyltransferase [Oharaeibacter diazotrophicus]